MNDDKTKKINLGNLFQKGELMKAGFKTTEFWVTAATIAGSTLASFSNNLDPKWATAAAAVSSIAYALSRGLAKSK